jgi:3-deoxy-D-manno-octulosonic-acid transferase
LIFFDITTNYIKFFNVNFIDFINGNKKMIKLFFLMLYNIFFILFLPFIVFVFLFRGSYNEILYRLSERFAIYKFSNKTLKKIFWIHCASLGEIRAVEPILEKFKDRYYIFLTSSTKSGREYAKKLKTVNFAALLSLDIYPIMSRAFNVIKPDVLVIVETEFWPTMLYIAANKKIKIITINGRISSKSFKIYRRFKFFWNKFIGLISVFVARSKEDADNFIFLTNKKNKIVISGNIKYDKDLTLSFKKKDLFLKGRDFIFTAGSIRAGEEKIIIDVYNKISSNFNNIKFFIAPRHIVRIKKLIKILKNKHTKYSLFSDNFYTNRLVLVDVFGKLQDIYAVSDVCYVGGSLVNKGGQNPIEPAIYAKPVLFGKNMNNFKTESEILKKYGGAFVVQDMDDLVYKLKKFILDRNFLKNTGLKAFKAVTSQKGAVSFTIKQIKENLNA